VAELAFTGKDITAERAHAIGLVNDVAPDAAAVVAAAGSRPRDRGELPARRRGHEGGAAGGRRSTVAEGLEYVATWNAGMLGSDDLTEAMLAFLEKRPPKFTGN